MRYSLRPYQSAAIDELRANIRAGISRQILMAPTGAGKTVTFAHLIESAAKRGKYCHVWCHRKELVEQCSEKLFALGVEHGIIRANDPRRRPWAGVHVATVQTLRNREIQREPDLIIVDECFRGETSVSTPFGEKPIRDIRVGSLVFNATGAGTVLAISTRQVRELVRLTLSNGTTIECTGSHPFFTDRGWVKARSLDIGTGLFNAERVRILQESFSTMDKEGRIRQSDERLLGIDMEATKLLQLVLLKESEKPNEQSCFPHEAAFNIETDKAFPDSAWRKRKVASNSATGAASCIRRWMASGSGYSNENEASSGRLSDLLQTGHCQREPENRNRIGWRDAFRRARSIGPKEGSIPGIVRVESVSRIKCESDGTVYNLHVSGHPSYFAGGVLVHNCHLSISKTWRELIARFPRAFVVGATATPGRPDGKAMGLIYQRIVPGPSIRELTNDGFLVPVRYFVYQRPAEMGDVKTVRGDYDQSAMAAIFEKSTIVGDIVDHWMRLARQKKTILFAASIKASLEMVEKFRCLGIRAEHLDGTTPEGERTAILRRLKSGETQLLSNVGVMDEGVDEPSVECIDLGSSTKSVVKYLQRIGRGLRPFGGKTDCMVLDHGGCIYDNGRYDDDREWSLEGRKRESGPKIEIGESFKVCPVCNSVCDKNETLCACGYRFHKVERKPIEMEGELEEVGEDFAIKPKFTIRKPSKDPAVFRLQQIAEQNNYKPGWMWMQRNRLLEARSEYATEFGTEPPTEFDTSELWREINQARRMSV